MYMPIHLGVFNRLISTAMGEAVRDSTFGLENPIMPNESNPKHLDTDEERAPIQGGIPIYNDLELVKQSDLSMGAILRGTAANPLTNFEKKAAFINAELDKFGMGRYQWCIWFLCGFGYFLDLGKESIWSCDVNTLC